MNDLALIEKNPEAGKIRLRTRDTEFWNSSDTVDYFAGKAPDPRVMDVIRNTSSRQNILGVDIGCGGGRHTQGLAENDIYTIAIDLNAAMLDATRIRTSQLATRISFIHGTVTSIPIKENSIDIAVSTGVVHQATCKAEVNAALDGISRITKEGAMFVGNMFVSDVWDDTYLIPDQQRPEYIQTKEGVGMTLVSAEVLEGMFESNGFRFCEEPVVDYKLENTGPRGVFRFLVESTS